MSEIVLFFRRIRHGVLRSKKNLLGPERSGSRRGSVAVTRGKGLRWVVPFTIDSAYKRSARFLDLEMSNLSGLTSNGIVNISGASGLPVRVLAFWDVGLSFGRRKERVSAQIERFAVGHVLLLPAASIHAWTNPRGVVGRLELDLPKINCAGTTLIR